MSKASAATIDALARRNYEAAMAAPWDNASPEVRADWIEEAAEQSQIVLDGISPDPLWEAMDVKLSNDPFYDDFEDDAR
jgi:hypothetical protein